VYISIEDIKAFSLLELLITVAIIGVLMAFVLPYYQDYVIRSKLAAGKVILEDLTQQSTQYHNVNGVFPTLTDLKKLNTDFATDAISWGNMGSKGWTGGDSTVPYVEIQFNTDTIPGQVAPRLAFIATVSGKNVTWACYTYSVSNVNSSINEKFLPPNCTVHQ